MLYDGHKIVAITPALDEEKTIEQVVRSAKNYADIVIVIDDASSDDTGMHAKQGGAYVIRNEKNMGYTSSIERGFQKAREFGATVLVTLDADGQHKSSDIARVSELIIARKADIVIGERGEYRKKMIESFIAAWTRMRFQINDPLCGLKAYSREVYEGVGHFDTQKLIGAQLAIEAVKNGFVNINMPIEIVRREDESRFYRKNISANLKVFHAFLRILFL